MLSILDSLEEGWDHSVVNICNSDKRGKNQLLSHLGILCSNTPLSGVTDLGHMRHKSVIRVYSFHFYLEEV